MTICSIRKEVTSVAKGDDTSPPPFAVQTTTRVSAEYWFHSPPCWMIDRASSSSSSDRKKNETNPAFLFRQSIRLLVLPPTGERVNWMCNLVSRTVAKLQWNGPVDNLRPFVYIVRYFCNEQDFSSAEELDVDSNENSCSCKEIGFPNHFRFQFIREYPATTRVTVYTTSITRMDSGFPTR